MADVKHSTSAGLRVLPVAAACFLCAVAAGILATTLVGQAPAPRATLDLPVLREKRAAAPLEAGAQSPPAPSFIHRPVFTGRALMADPALKGNSL